MQVCVCVCVCIVEVKPSLAYSCSYTTCPELLYKDLCKGVSLSLQYVLCVSEDVCVCVCVCVRVCPAMCLAMCLCFCCSVCKSHTTRFVSLCLVNFQLNVTLTTIVSLNNLAKCVWENGKKQSTSQAQRAKHTLKDERCTRSLHKLIARLDTYDISCRQTCHVTSLYGYEAQSHSKTLIGIHLTTNAP